MNIFESLICSQYAALKMKGSGQSAKANGVVLISVALMMHLLTLLFILVITKSNIVRIDTHGLNGKIFGKLLAFGLIAALYPIVYFFYGRQQRFDRITQQFDGLMEPEQKAVIKKGLYYLLASFGIFIIVLMVLLFKK